MSLSTVATDTPASPPASPDQDVFRAMLDRLPAAAYACDADGLITYYNAKAVEIWGRKPKLFHDEDRFCGSYRMFTFDGEPVAHERCWMALAIKHRREYLACELLVERPDAALVPVLAYSTPLFGEDGEVVAGINMLVDISERKRFERLLKDANETRNLYMGTLADELRIQLDAVSGLLKHVEGRLASDGQTQRTVELIQARLQEMTSLVVDLLDMPRVRPAVSLMRETDEIAVRA